MIKLAHGLSNPPRPDSIIGFVKLTTSPSAPLVSTLCLGEVDPDNVDLVLHGGLLPCQSEGAHPVEKIPKQ